MISTQHPGGLCSAEKRSENSPMEIDRLPKFVLMEKTKILGWEEKFFCLLPKIPALKRLFLFNKI